MTISDQILAEKENFQLGGYRNSSFGDITQRGIDFLANGAFSYANGLSIGQGLGYTPESQKTLGMIGLINSGLNSTASFIQDQRRNSESRQRAEDRRLLEYQRVPRDRYAYDPYSQNSYTQDYYQRGGTHGVRTLNTFNRDGYKRGPRNNKLTQNNIYDSYTPIKNRKVGPARDGFTSVFGKDGLEFSHVTNTNGRTFAPTERHINNTGYTRGSDTEFNPYNIIPGNHITGKPMRSGTVLDVFPIFSSGEIGRRFPFSRNSQDVITDGAIAHLEIKK